MRSRSDSALIALRRILRATEFNARNLARVSALTPSQVLTLQYLKESGGAAPSEIAAHASLKQATVTSLLYRLEARELITRQKDSKDGRRLFVTLTSAGEKALDSAPDPLQQLFQERFDKMENWEQASIIASLERVASMLNAENIEAGPVLDIGALDEPPRKSD